MLYRRASSGWEVLLVHGSGWYNRNKPWSIPKGEPDEDEPLEAAARRETLEETGLQCGELTYLGVITYKKSGKQVHAFAGPAPADQSPCCASWEIDAAEFVSFAEARERLHPDQRVFVDWLEKHLGET